MSDSGAHKPGRRPWAVFLARLAVVGLAMMAAKTVITVGWMLAQPDFMSRLIAGRYDQAGSAIKAYSSDWLSLALIGSALLSLVICGLLGRWQWQRAGWGVPMVLALLCAIELWSVRASYQIENGFVVALVDGWFLMSDTLAAILLFLYLAATIGGLCNKRLAKLGRNPITEP